MTKPPKIAKARGRAVAEWIGKTPDAKVPAHVRLRILRRFSGKCYLTGIMIADGQAFDLEDIRPLRKAASGVSQTLLQCCAFRTKSKQQPSERGRRKPTASRKQRTE
jgi:hypothetical protein